MRMTHSPEALAEAKSLLHTLFRARNEGGILEMSNIYTPMETTHPCGTACCVIGWHRAFHPVTNEHGLMFRTPERITGHDRGTEAEQAAKHRKVMFGGHRDKTRRGERLTSDEQYRRQINVFRWYIRREESLREYEAVESLPKRERRAMQKAVRRLEIA